MLSPRSSLVEKLPRVQITLGWISLTCSNKYSWQDSISLGWGQAEYLASGNVWVVRRHEIDYLMPVTVGQQLVGETWVDPWKAASCVRRTELVRDGAVVVRAATTWAFIAIASGKPQRIPDQMKALFS